MYIIVILAAGRSARLGQPKQLLQLGSIPLIKLVCMQALASKADAVIVITGEEHTNIIDALADIEVNIVQNAKWHEGMASSIHTGVVEASKLNASACIVAVCDQPFITSSTFDSLIKQHQEYRPIVAATYGGTTGTPVLFDKIYFDELKQLQGDSGAKKLLTLHSSNVVTIPFAEGVFDIDTWDDYLRLKAAVPED